MEYAPTKWQCPRISDPTKFVEVTVKDLGDKTPLCDAEGKQLRGQTTRFMFLGKVEYSFMGVGCRSAEERMNYDAVMLKRHDIDLHGAVGI